MKKVFLLVVVLTGLCALAYAQFPQGFENGGAVPTGWTLLDVNGNSGGKNGDWTIQSDFPHTGTYALAIWYDNRQPSPIDDDWAFSGAVSLAAGTSYRLKLWVKSGSTTGEYMNIWYGTAQDPATMTNSIVGTTTYTSSTYTLFTYTFTASGTDSYYLGFHSVSDASLDNYLYLDDITLETIGPDDYTTTAITSPNTGRYDPNATVNVTATVQNLGTNTEAAQVYYQFNGGAVVGPENTSVLAQNGTQTLTFATPLTTPAADGYYTLNVWTVVSGDVSPGNDQLSMQVYVHDCSVALPLSENFDLTTGTALPSCWVQQDVNADSKKWTTSSSSSLRCGTVGRGANITNTTSPYTCDDWMFTCGLRLTGGVTYRLSYGVKVSNATYGATYEVKWGNAQNASGMTGGTLVPSYMETYATSTCLAKGPYTFTPGTTGTYFIGWHATVARAYLVIDNVTVDAAPATGRCCYSGGCANDLQADCNTLGGIWTFGVTCEANPCPPVNDDCATAIALAIPSNTQTDNTYAALDVSPSCGDGTPFRGMWYTVAGNGNVLTASTCNSYGTLADTKLQVFSGACGSFTCVGGNDNYSACASGGAKSQVVWCSEVGVTYYVLVGGATGTGTFQLDVVDGPTCHNNCQTWAPCGTLSETEPNDACTSPDPLVISACGQTVYGTICPVNDMDFYTLVVPPMKILTVSIFDGPSCSVTPTAFAVFDLDSSNCAASQTNLHTNVVINNRTANPKNFIVRVHSDGVHEKPYSLVTSCCDVVDYMANPIFIHYDPASPNVYTQTIGTCCASIPIPYVWSSGCGVGAQGQSGPAVVWKFTLSSAGFCTFTATTPPGNDVQLMVFTDPSNPYASCVASKDAGTPYVIPNLSLAAGTYYVSASMYTGFIQPPLCGEVTMTISSDVPLPVELESTPVITPGDGSLTLNWATASETNNQRFDIVRDGQVVGRVNGAGTSPTRHAYRWMDQNLTNGTSYSYTLRSVGLDGTHRDLATVSAAPSFMVVEVTEYALHQNFPNPFNPTTSIAVDLVEAGNVSLKVYNLMGQEVASLVNGNMDKGRHVVSFNATNLPSAIYLCRLSVNGFVAENKMLLMK